VNKSYFSEKAPLCLKKAMQKIFCVLLLKTNPNMNRMRMGRLLVEGDTSHIGRVGEFFAIYKLEKYGIECHHVDRSGIDLWCQSLDNSLFTVQVKASNICHFNQHNKRPAFSGYAYNLRSDHVADFYVFVALDIERMIVKPVEELEGKTQLQLTASDFTREEELEGVSLLRSFKREDHLQSKCKQVLS
jgi:hypothetical protein